MKGTKRNRFLDDAADLSGSDSGDESEGEDLPTAEDAAFIDDAPVPEERAAKRVRFARCEREVCEDDLELVRENCGLSRTKSAAAPEATTVYADSDESGADSDDDGFVVPDPVERRAETLLRKFVSKSRELAARVLAWFARVVVLARAMRA
jgi:hypothetical protein